MASSCKKCGLPPPSADARFKPPRTVAPLLLDTFIHTGVILCAAAGVWSAALLAPLTALEASLETHAYGPSSLALCAGVTVAFVLHVYQAVALAVRTKRYGALSAGRTLSVTAMSHVAAAAIGGPHTVATAWMAAAVANGWWKISAPASGGEPPEVWIAAGCVAGVGIVHQAVVVSVGRRLLSLPLAVSASAAVCSFLSVVSVAACAGTAVSPLAGGPFHGYEFAPAVAGCLGISLLSAWGVWRSSRRFACMTDASGGGLRAPGSVSARAMAGYLVAQRVGSLAVSVVASVAVGSTAGVVAWTRSGLDGDDPDGGTGVVPWARVVSPVKVLAWVCFFVASGCAAAHGVNVMVRRRAARLIAVAVNTGQNQAEASKRGGRAQALTHLPHLRHIGPLETTQGTVWRAASSICHVSAGASALLLAARMGQAVPTISYDAVLAPLLVPALVLAAACVPIATTLSSFGPAVAFARVAQRTHLWPAAVLGNPVASATWILLLLWLRGGTGSGRLGGGGGGGGGAGGAIEGIGDDVTLGLVVVENGLADALAPLGVAVATAVIAGVPMAFGFRYHGSTMTAASAASAASASAVAGSTAAAVRKRNGGGNRWAWCVGTLLASAGLVGVPIGDCSVRGSFDWRFTAVPLAVFCAGLVAGSAHWLRGLSARGSGGRLREAGIARLRRHAGAAVSALAASLSLLLAVLILIFLPAGEVGTASSSSGGGGGGGGVVGTSSRGAATLPIAALGAAHAIVELSLLAVAILRRGARAGVGCLAARPTAADAEQKGKADGENGDGDGSAARPPPWYSLVLAPISELPGGREGFLGTATLHTCLALVGCSAAAGLRFVLVGSPSPTVAASAVLVPIYIVACVHALHFFCFIATWSLTSATVAAARCAERPSMLVAAAFGNVFLLVTAALGHVRLSGGGLPLAIVPVPIAIGSGVLGVMGVMMRWVAPSFDAGYAVGAAQPKGEGGINGAASEKGGGDSVDAAVTVRLGPDDTVATVALPPPAGKTAPGEVARRWSARMTATASLLFLASALCVVALQIPGRDSDSDSSDANGAEKRASTGRVIAACSGAVAAIFLGMGLVGVAWLRRSRVGAPWWSKAAWSWCYMSVTIVAACGVMQVSLGPQWDGTADSQDAGGAPMFPVVAWSLGLGMLAVTGLCSAALLAYRAWFTLLPIYRRAPEPVTDVRLYLAETRDGRVAVLVAWGCPVTGGSPITAYVVEVSHGYGFESGNREVREEVRVPPGPRRYLLEGLVAGHYYAVRIRACNALGEGQPGPARDATLPASVPGVPVVSIVGSSSTSFSLSVAVPDGHGAPVESLVVRYASLERARRRSRSRNARRESAGSPSGGPNHQLPSRFARSPPQSLSPYQSPLPPPLLHDAADFVSPRGGGDADNGMVSSSSLFLDVGHDVLDSQGHLRRDGEPGDGIDGADEELVFTIDDTGPADAPVEINVSGLDPFCEYWFCASATNARGRGPFSAPVTSTTNVTAPDPPSAPWCAAARATGLTVAWVDGDALRGVDIGSYTVRGARDPGFNDVVLSRVVPAPSTSDVVEFDAEGLDPDSVYYFQVRAEGADVNIHSAWSDVSGAMKTGSAPPSAIEELVFQPRATALDLEWQLPRANGCPVLVYEFQVAMSVRALVTAGTPGSGPRMGPTVSSRFARNDKRSRGRKRHGNDTDESDDDDESSYSGTASSSSEFTDRDTPGGSHQAVRTHRLDTLTAGNGWSLADWGLFTIPDLQPGTVYFVRARAINAAGPGQWSRPQQVRTEELGSGARGKSPGRAAYSYEDAVRVPEYWTVDAMGVSAVVDCTSDMRGDVQELLDKTCFSQYIGIGRDSHGLKHKRFVVEKVERIQRPRLWAIYAAKREFVRSRYDIDAQVTVLTDMDWMTDLDPSVNEKYLLHGTKPNAVETISKHGFEERIASDGLFGHGSYFAEASSKSDEYIVPDGGGLCYIFMARVVLGKPFVTTQMHKGIKRPPCVKGHFDSDTRCDHDRYDSILAEVDSPRYPGALLKRYREFVVYDKGLTYPEFLIAFRRV